MIIQQFINLLIRQQALIHALQPLLLILNNAVLDLRNGRIYTASGLEVVAAEPLVAVHGDVLCWLVAIDYKVFVMNVPYARLRPYASLVGVVVPPAHIEPILLLIVILTNFLILPRPTVIRRFATMYTADILPILYYV